MFENKLSFIGKSKDKRKKKDIRIIYLEIEEIIKNPYQPRKFFDIKSLTELSESIKAYGIIQPVNVRKTPAGNYELITGERRLRAALMAGMKKIPCIVVNVDDNDSALMALIENLQREDLNCIEEAEAYGRILKEYNMTQEELGIQIGKSQAAIANKIRLLKLSPMVKTVLINHNLSERHARCLLQLGSEEQQLKILRKVREGNLSVSDTEMLVRNIGHGSSTCDKESEVTGTRKAAVMDIRIFVNTVKQAIDLMIKSGIQAESVQTDSDEFYEFVVKIPKQ